MADSRQPLMEYLCPAALVARSHSSQELCSFHLRSMVQPTELATQNTNLFIFLV